MLASLQLSIVLDKETVSSVIQRKVEHVPGVFPASPSRWLASRSRLIRPPTFTILQALSFLRLKTLLSQWNWACAIAFVMGLSSQRLCATTHFTCSTSIDNLGMSRDTTCLVIFPQTASTTCCWASKSGWDYKTEPRHKTNSYMTSETGPLAKSSWINHYDRLVILTLAEKRHYNLQVDIQLVFD